MPTATVNGIDIHYRLAGDGGETIVLVNGLADDLETWAFQEEELTGAGYRLLLFDNRGVGRTSKPAGPYSASMMAGDAKALVDHLGITGFHLLGVSMGGMIVQEYALAYPGDLKSLTLACTYAAPGPFCSRMFAMWADAAQVLGVPFVMRDVTLWAFTVPFFQTRQDELAEFETAMRYMDQPVPAYLAQLAVIQQHDTTGRLGQITTPALVLAGEQDILIPVSLSRELHEGIPGAEWQTVKGGHACLWEHPASFNAAVLDFVRRHGKGELCLRTPDPPAGRMASPPRPPAKWPPATAPWPPRRAARGACDTAITQIVTIAYGVLVVLPVVLRLKSGVRTTVVLCLFEVVPLLVLAITILVKGGAQGLSAAPFRWPSGSGTTDIFVAFSFAVLAFGGSEAAAPLAEETRNPRRNVPFGVIGTVVVSGVLYVFCSCALIIAFGTGHISALAADGNAFGTAAHAFVPALAPLITWIFLSSVTSSHVAANTQTSRVIFAGARGGLWSRTLAAVGPRFRTPWAAAIAFVAPASRSA